MAKNKEHFIVKKSRKVKVDYTEQYDKILGEQDLNNPTQVDKSIKELEQFRVEVQAAKNNITKKNKKQFTALGISSIASVAAAIGIPLGVIGIFNDSLPMLTFVGSFVIGGITAASLLVTAIVKNVKNKRNVKKADNLLLNSDNVLKANKEKKITKTNAETEVKTTEAVDKKVETAKPPVYALQIKITNPKKPGLKAETVYSYSPEGPECLFNFIRGLKEISEGKNEEFNTVLQGHREEGADMQIIVTNPDNHSKTIKLRPKKKVSTVYKDLGEVATALRKSVLTQSVVH